MNRLSAALIAATTVALTQIASAADMPRKAPLYTPPPSVPVYSWTGCYVGLNAGGVRGHMDDDWTTPIKATLPLAPTLILANGDATLNGSGFTGGGQVGCNWQMNAFVLGAEADIQYTGLDERRDVLIQPQQAQAIIINIHEDFRSKWLATFRGRLGWLFTPTVLVYGTGGLALTNVETTDIAAQVDGPSFTAFASETRAGWTVGGGVEWMFAPRWSVKAEYLYVDLGSFRTASVGTNSFPFNQDHHLTENIARVGVNYHF